jgi:hypothetical protein
MEDSNTKRKRAIDYSSCIICQDIKSEHLRSGEQGNLTLKSAANRRSSLKDYDSKPAIDRIEETPPTGCAIQWHKSCYTTFTSNLHMQRLAQRNKAPSTQKGNAEEDTAGPCRTTRRSSSSVNVNWDLCIFCQRQSEKPDWDKGVVHAVCTFNVSQNIIESAKYHSTVQTRLAGVNDLMAAEAKYHLPCLANFRREVNKTRNSAEENRRAHGMVDCRIKGGGGTSSDPATL